jgi:copper chaperone CopZ
MQHRYGGRLKEEEFMQAYDSVLNKINKQKVYMKLLKLILIISLLISGRVSLYAQTDTVRIKTSAVCDQCKEKIENDLSFEKGVKTVKLDLTTKEVTVVYNAKKTDEQKIREAITQIGYDADTLKANAKAFNKLPDCCKKPVAH